MGVEKHTLDAGDGQRGPDCTRRQVMRPNAVGSGADQAFADEELREANGLPIASVASALSAAGALHDLRAAGQRWVFRCPQHDDKHPSAYLYSGSQWHCPVCLAGGDVAGLVMAALEVRLPLAISWLRDRFPLSSAAGPHDNAISQWAQIRGLPVEAVLAFAPEVRKEHGHDVLCFPRRLRPEGDIEAYQKRRADNRPITGTKRSISKGRMDGLFFPKDWSLVEDDSILVIAEGVPDTIGGYAAGFLHAVGTPGKGWSKGVISTLREVALQFKQKVLVVDGDVPDHGDDGLFARARDLGAVPVRVPPHVAGKRSRRDLNEWLAKTSAADVSSYIHNELSETVPFTAFRQDAIPNLRALAKEYGGGLRKPHFATHDCLALYLLRGLSAFHHRGEVRGVTVGPQQFFTSMPLLAEQAGCSERTAETILSKWRKADVLHWKAEHGTNGTPGILITWHNLSEYTRVTKKTYDKFLRSKPAYGSELSQPA